MLGVKRTTTDPQEANLPQHECITCGQPYAARNKQARYCDLCRLYQNIRARLESRADCKVCGQPFAPIHSGDKACSACDPAATRTTRDGDPCRLCGERRKLFRDGLIRVCYVCLHDPDRRLDVVRGLARKIQERQDG